MRGVESRTNAAPGSAEISVPEGDSEEVGELYEVVEFGKQGG